MFARGFAAPILSTRLDRGGQGWARRKREIVLAGTYLGLCFLTGFTWISGTLAVFLAISLLRYFAVGAGEANEVTAVSEWWTRERRGFALGAHHTAFPWGSFIGSQIIALILAWSNNDWRLAYLFFPLLGAPILVLYWVTSTKARYAKVLKFAREQGEEMAL